MVKYSVLGDSVSERCVPDVSLAKHDVAELTNRKPYVLSRLDPEQRVKGQLVL